MTWIILSGELCVIPDSFLMEGWGESVYTCYLLAPILVLLCAPQVIHAIWLWGITCQGSITWRSWEQISKMMQYTSAKPFKRPSVPDQPGWPFLVGISFFLGNDGIYFFPKWERNEMSFEMSTWFSEHRLALHGKNCLGFFKWIAWRRFRGRSNSGEKGRWKWQSCDIFPPPSP